MGGRLPPAFRDKGCCGGSGGCGGGGGRCGGCSGSGRGGNTGCGPGCGGGGGRCGGGSGSGGGGNTGCGPGCGGAPPVAPPPRAGAPPASASNKARWSRSAGRREAPVPPRSRAGVGGVAAGSTGTSSPMPPSVQPSGKGTGGGPVKVTTSCRWRGGKGRTGGIGGSTGPTLSARMGKVPTSQSQWMAGVKRPVSGQ